MSRWIGLAPAVVTLLLASGSAGAWELKLNGSAPDGAGASVPGADFPASGVGDGALTADSGAMVLASDVAWRDGAGLGVSGTAARRSQDFAFLIDAQGTETAPEQFESGMRYYMDVALTNAMLQSGLDGGISAYSGTAANTPVAGITIVDPAPAGTGTGMAGQTSVRLQLVAAANIRDVYLTLPIELSNAICGGTVNNASLSVTLSSVTPATPPTGTETETVTPIGSPLSKTFVECGAAYGLTLAADTAAGGGDSALVAPALNAFVAGTAGPTIDVNGDAAGTGLADGTSLADTATRAAVGYYQIAFAPDSAAGTDKSTLSYVYDMSDWQGRALTGNLSSLFVTGSTIQFTLQTTSTGNLASAEVGYPANSLVSAGFGSGVRASVVVSPPSGTVNTTNLSQAIFVTLADPPAGSAEEISASARVNFAGTALQSVFAGGHLSFGPEVALDSIGFQAGYCGQFDWIGSSFDRFNMIRLTGFGPDVTQVVATLTGADQPVTWMSSEFGEISNGDQARELVITTNDLRNKFGNDFATGDLHLMVMGAAGTLDCDRLIGLGSSGFVTPYGNDASVTDGDGDD